MLLLATKFPVEVTVQLQCIGGADVCVCVWGGGGGGKGGLMSMHVACLCCLISPMSHVDFKKSLFMSHFTIF